VPRPNKKRYLILAAVVGAHALVVGALLRRSRSISLYSPTTIPITAFLLTRPVRPRSPIARPRLKATSAPPITEPITLATPVLPVTSPSGPAVDWDAQGKRSVARILEPSNRISFGFPPPRESAIKLGVVPPLPAHYAGEQYRTEAGEQIYWVNNRCYLVSDPPSLFEPDFLNNARQSRMTCN
jgi:hypothetical protein